MSVCPCAHVFVSSIYFYVHTRMHTQQPCSRTRNLHLTPTHGTASMKPQHRRVQTHVCPPRMPLPLCPPAACPRWGQQDSPMLPIAFPGSCFPVAPVSRGAQLSPSVISREEGQPGKCPSPSPSVLRFPTGAPCAGRRCRQAARTEGKPAAPPPVFSIF